MNTEQTTDVVFRMVRGAYPGAQPECLAMFPGLPGTRDPHTCSSYAHVGQHGSAQASGHGWPLATPEQYAPLLRELEGAPYRYRLRVLKRAAPHHYRARLEACK